MNPIYTSRRRVDKIIRGLCFGAAAFGVSWLTKGEAILSDK